MTARRKQIIPPLILFGKVDDDPFQQRLYGWKLTVPEGAFTLAFISRYKGYVFSLIGNSNFHLLSVNEPTIIGYTYALAPAIHACYTLDTNTTLAVQRPRHSVA